LRGAARVSASVTSRGSTVFILWAGEKKRQTNYSLETQPAVRH
jgi:hypothetical protein